MRKLSILMVSLVGISALSFGFAGGMDDEAAKSERTEFLKLKSEFADLTKRVGDLEDKVHQLETRPNVVVGAVPTPDQKGVPKAWQQREFNGQPYFVVPLAETKSKR